jgi:hypothetical protein
MVKEISIETLTDLHVFAVPEYADVVFGMRLPVVRVCAPQQLFVCTNILRLTLYPS